MRGLAGVAAGIAVIMLALFVAAESLWAGVAAVVALAIGAGFITAQIAGRHQFRYAGILGLSMVALAVFTMRARGAVQPGWFELAMGGCGPVAGYLGAGLRMLTARS